MSGQPDAWPVVTFPVVELVFWLVPNYTAWRQRHMFVNSLPEVVSWDWNGPELNFELQVQRFNHYFTRPQFYQWWVHICSTLQDWSWLCNHTVSCWHAMCCLFFLCSVQMCCKYFVLLVTARLCYADFTTTNYGPFSRTTWVSRYQIGKTNLDFTGARVSEENCYARLSHSNTVLK